MFICLPILFGCQTSMKPVGDQFARVCPRCHNASVIYAKKTTWFELFFVPIIPVSSKNVWFCGICQWMGVTVPGQEPPVAQQGPAPGGYAPAYFSGQPPPQK